MYVIIIIIIIIIIITIIIIVLIVCMSLMSHQIQGAIKRRRGKKRGGFVLSSPRFRLLFNLKFHRAVYWLGKRIVL